MSLRRIRSARILIVLFVGVVPLLIGCANRESTKVTTTEIRSDPDYTKESTSEGRSTVQVTTTEEVSQDDGHKGFFGIVGDIIALPFRAIGSIL